MRNDVKNKGFTLIELIIVIAILGILAMIVIPQVTSFIEQAKVSADQTTVRTLNSVTALYGVTNNTEDDIFDGFGSDEARIDELRDAGLLFSTVEPQLENAEFVWDIDHQYWLYYNPISDELTFIYYLLTSSDYTNKGTTLTNYLNEVEKNIQIPEGIISILGGRDVSAFWEKGLESVILPNSLKNIYAHAFDGNNLKEILIPEDVIFIGTNAFANNPITKIAMLSEPSQVTIQDRVFGTGWTESKLMTDSFKVAYTSGGPGTYEWLDNTWVKTE